MNRHTSTVVISAFRATSIVDTPMRKVELLEAVDGRVLLRATEFNSNIRADVSIIHLERHEADALAQAIRNLGLVEEEEKVTRRRKST